ncbi:MAG: DUF2911 domain-containing protein [Balneola sp.]|nr:MAG: DUF2911 domain-containing protein [Balneola sp.]
MAVNLSRKLKFILFGLLPFSILIFFVATGYHHVPVDMTLGSCIKDYTSPSTYMKRPSPLQTLDFELEGDRVLVCYGSPSARERKVFGGIVPYDRLWRFGANEPTRLYTSTDLVIGEVVVPKGRYSVYAIPGEYSWEVFISTSTFHWGNVINRSVRENEIGSFDIQPESNDSFVESFTIRFEEAELLVEWENTRLRIPVTNIREG